MSECPGLAPDQVEALALLLEECAESIAIVGKALRHGLNSFHPDSGTMNRYEIARELGQVQAAIEIACQLGVLSRGDVRTGCEEKWKKVGRYLHHIQIDSVMRTATRLDRKRTEEGER